MASKYKLPFAVIPEFAGFHFTSLHFTYVACHVQKETKEGRKQMENLIIQPCDLDFVFICYYL